MRSVARAMLILTVLVAGCGAPASAPDAGGTWVGTIITEGNVTTVVNESGAVWGGTATLVEEASIGVESGAEEYMLGDVRAVFATSEHIYVVDGQVPLLRYYDLDGVFLGNIGGRGQGPGEYLEPAMLTGDQAGRIFLYDTRKGINVYSEAGESLETWSYGVGPGAMVPTQAGTLWVPTRIRDRTTGRSVYGVGEYGKDGLIGDVRFPREVAFEPIEMTVMTRFGGEAYVAVPFAPHAPRSVLTITSSGSIVVGASDRYRFEVQSENGAVIAVEKRWTPVPVEPEEADWHRRLLVSTLRAEMAPPEWDWDGAEIPPNKPAFTYLIAAASGEIWVVRPGKGERLPDCIQDPLQAGHVQARDAPCWRDRTLLDVFDAEGRYLGEVTPPDYFGTNLHINGDTIVSVVEDEAGTIMVKRYRLVLPGEE